MDDGRSTWGIVLAAGEGSRLRSLTTDRAGRAVPKQFCSLRGGRSLFGEAVERARRVADPGRVVTVVAAEQRPHWEEQVAGLHPANVIVQPQNRGTAAGILLPLLAIHERDPDARVAVLPSDHHVREEPVLERTLREALLVAEQEPHRVCLLGMEPDAPETGYGWIVPGPARPGWRRPRSVVEFVEKPDALGAHELLARGAVWNTFLLAGTADAFLELYARQLPDLLAAFTTAFLARTPHRAAWLDMLYAGISAHDFSRELLQNAPRDLNLLQVPACGWTDLGTPARVAQCLRSEHEPPVLQPGPAGQLVLARALGERSA